MTRSARPRHPLAAGIFKMVPQRMCKKDPGESAAGFFLTTREFDNFRNELRDDLGDLKLEIAEVRRIVDPLR